MSSLSVSDRTISAIEFQRAVGRALDLNWPRPNEEYRSDFDLNPLPSVSKDPTIYRPAAVLIPVVDRGHGDAGVILTRRTDHLAAHAGQVAFPGGKIDKGETTGLQTALREAKEEIGLSSSDVTPLGYLDAYLTSTRYRVFPVVALVPADLVYRPEPGEVAEIFEVPLSFLMNPANHQISSREWKGIERYFYSMPYGPHYIWGVTAGIIRLLYDRVFRE